MTQFIQSLIFPQAGKPLDVYSVEVEVNCRLKEGSLIERSSGTIVPVRNFIPRFIKDNSYNKSFALEWERYKRTLLDRYNGTTISRDLVFSCSGWKPEELKGQRVLEAGCGSGRFTQILLDAGAYVYSLDYTTAVDVCWENNGPHPRLFIVQADIYSIPFRDGFFDKVFCHGVLQHTPDPKKAFMSLVPFLKPGGKIAIDVYVKPVWSNLRTRWTSKYLWRHVTKRMPGKLLLKIVEFYIPLWLPADNILRRVPKLGRFLVSIVPCWNYTDMLPLKPEQIREWAILNTFDALASWYDFPQTKEEVRSWFKGANLQDIVVRRGGNGIIGRGVAEMQI